MARSSRTAHRRRRTREPGAWPRPDLVDVAGDQYAALEPADQHLVDLRLAELLDHPDGSGCSEDATTGQWLTRTNGADVLAPSLRGVTLPEGVAASRIADRPTCA